MVERSDVRWQWASRLAGMGLAVLAGLLLLLQVRVNAGGVRLACGSSWDVISGRTGWREWWSADQLAAVSPASPASAAVALPRTVRCPDAVDARMWLAAAAFLGALAVAGAGELIGRSRTRREARTRQHSRRSPVVATALVVAGGALTLAGVVGIALLTADPQDSLFLYVSRPVVVLIGLLLLSPAVLITALGLLARSTRVPARGGGPEDEVD